MSKIAKQISKARAALILDQPFFASLLLPMPIIETRDISTFATDGESIAYNPDWADTLTQGETTFVMGHEVMHCVLDHMGRRGTRDHNLWNQAADYVINGMLSKESRLGTMPKGGLLDDALVAKGGGTAEGVYKLLPKSNKNKSAGDKGGAMDSVTDGKINVTKDASGNVKVTITQLDPAAKEKRSAETKVKVIQATNAAKMQGKLSSGMERLLGEALKPVVDWREVLRRFVSERAKVDYSFARPKRRFLGEDLYLPSLTGEKMGALVVAVDCSGSVNQELLNKFAAEINAIKQDVHPSKIEVVYFDSVVCGTETFEADQEVKLKPMGGGGTAFSPVFKHINSQAEQPIAVIFLTDLCCSDFGPMPEYPVLWAVLEDRNSLTAPFGEIVPVRDLE